MLNIQDKSHLYDEEKEISDAVNKISIDAKFCLRNPGLDSNELTSLGFHYVLLDIPV
jgi:hypothetical protein